MGEKLDKLGKSVGNASKAVVIANLFMNIFLGGALQELFSAMAKMQIMVHLLIVNVKIPANATIYFNGLLSLVTFNIIDLTPSIRKALSIPKNNEVKINDNFTALGYNSSHFIINMGNLVIVGAY